MKSKKSFWIILGCMVFLFLLFFSIGFYNNYKEFIACKTMKNYLELMHRETTSPFDINYFKGEARNHYIQIENHRKEELLNCKKVSDLIKYITTYRKEEPCVDLAMAKLKHIKAIEYKKVKSEDSDYIFQKSEYGREVVRSENEVSFLQRHYSLPMNKDIEIDINNIAYLNIDSLSNIFKVNSYMQIENGIDPNPHVVYLYDSNNNGNYNYYYKLIQYEDIKELNHKLTPVSDIKGFTHGFNWDNKVYYLYLDSY